MDFQAILLLYIKMGLYCYIVLILLAITPMSNEQMIHIKNKNTDHPRVSIRVRNGASKKWCEEHGVYLD